MTSDRFISDILVDAKIRLIRNQGSAIAAKTESHSGRLLSGRLAAVSNNILTMSHPAYLRFLDMRYLGDKKQPRRRIHNRFVYGTYSSIAEKILSGMAENSLPSVK